jgi:hypothetical protein
LELDVLLLLIACAVAVGECFLQCGIDGLQWNVPMK